MTDLKTATIFAVKICESCYSVGITVMGATPDDVVRRFKAWQDVVRQLQSDGWKIECDDLGNDDYEEPEEYGTNGNFFYPSAGLFFIECTEEELVDQVDWQKFSQVEQFWGYFSHLDDDNPIIVAEVVLTAPVP